MLLGGVGREWVGVCGMGWRERVWEWGCGRGWNGSGGLWALLGRCFDFLDFFGFWLLKLCDCGFEGRKVIAGGKEMDPG